jgi:hypothetical protein
MYSPWYPSAGERGYHAGDFNMNVEVDNRDKNDYFVPNFGNSSQVPD